jgi:hypothetical protein
MALDWPTLAGNHERQLLTLDPARMGPTDAAAHAVIDKDIRAWMAALPPRMEWPDGDVPCAMPRRKATILTGSTEGKRADGCVNPRWRKLRPMPARMP